jgi:hypothetical protein
MTDMPRDTEFELAALADGSLAGKRRERALAHVRGSRELQAALAEQRRVVELTAAVDVGAPVTLHRQIEGMLAPARRKRRLTALRVGFATAALATITAGALAVGLFGGGSSGLSVQRTATLTLSPATMPAPAESRANRAQLAAAVGSVPFPYWKERFGWRSSGARTDEIAGHSITTVFYTDATGHRIGYAIASGSAPVTHGGSVVRRWGVSYRVLSQKRATVVTWQRDGHLCVVAGHDVSARTLLNLASWGSEKRRPA